MKSLGADSLHAALHAKTGETLQPDVDAEDPEAALLQGNDHMTMTMQHRTMPRQGVAECVCKHRERSRVRGYSRCKASVPSPRHSSTGGFCVTLRHRRRHLLPRSEIIMRRRQAECVHWCISLSACENSNGILRDRACMDDVIDASSWIAVITGGGVCTT